MYALCAGEGVAYTAGLAITEGEKLIRNFLKEPGGSDAYSARDINGNGLSELLLITDPRKFPLSGENALQLYEFPNGNLTPPEEFPVGRPRPLNFLGGDYPSCAFSMGGPGAVSACQDDAKRPVISEVITVQKGRALTFFGESHRLNCTY